MDFLFKGNDMRKASSLPRSFHSFYSFYWVSIETSSMHEFTLNNICNIKNNKNLISGDEDVVKPCVCTGKRKSLCKSGNQT